MTTDIKWTQITKLNREVKVRIAPSKIHGVGIFAIQDIQKGDKLHLDDAPILYTLRHADFSKLNDVVSDLLLERWPQIVNGSNFLYPDSRLSAYMNHSDQPNVDAENDIALTDIAVGEELTEDYRLIPNWEKVHKYLLDKNEV